MTTTQDRRDASRAFAAYGAIGLVIVLVWVVFAVRERMEASQAQIALERKAMADIIDHAGSGLVVTDRQGKIQSWSKKLEEMTGFSAVEKVGTQIEDAMTEPFATRHRDGKAAYVNEGIFPDFVRQLPCKFKRKDGREVSVIAAVWVSYRLDRAVGIIVPQVAIEDPFEPELPDEIPIPTTPK